MPFLDTNGWVLIALRKAGFFAFLRFFVFLSRLFVAGFLASLLSGLFVVRGFLKSDR